MQPIFIHYKDLQLFQDKHPGLLVESRIDLAIDDLYDIAYPTKKDFKDVNAVQRFAKDLNGGDIEAWGNWVYYPWLNMIVHTPPSKELRALRCSRNRNLINEDEQAKLYQSTIMVAGLSVGSNVVESLISQGIGGSFILLDMDIIEPSNLNRIRSPYHHVGLHKVEAISRKIWETDPYISIQTYQEGLNDVNIRTIMDGPVDVIVDEVDDLRMKVLIREEAKKRELPVVMAADDGDDALIDIERYDLEPDLALFDGRIPDDVINRVKSGGIPRAELGIMIGRYFVGPENIPLRMYQSLMEVGKTLPSWPQLGGAAALSGVSISYAVKKILLGQGVRAGRTLVTIDQTLGTDQLGSEHSRQLQQFRDMMKGE
jgi:molybdopterin/thiamine biosynthesis adenylyltransferase